MCSHITDRASEAAKGPAFSRDCPEYYVELPSGRQNRWAFASLRAQEVK
jgi:hypothetical protein